MAHHLFSPISQSCSSNDLSFLPPKYRGIYLCKASGFQFLAEALRKLPSAVLGFCKFLLKLPSLALQQVDYSWYSRNNAKSSANLKYQPQPPHPTPSPFLLCLPHLSILPTSLPPLLFSSPIFFPFFPMSFPFLSLKHSVEVDCNFPLEESREFAWRSHRFKPAISLLSFSLSLSDPAWP